MCPSLVEILVVVTEPTTTWNHLMELKAPLYSSHGNTRHFFVYCRTRGTSADDLFMLIVTSHHHQMVKATSHTLPSVILYHKLLHAMRTSSLVQQFSSAACPSVSPWQPPPAPGCVSCSRPFWSAAARWSVQTSGCVFQTELWYVSAAS